MDTKKIDIKQKLEAIQQIVTTLSQFPAQDIRDIVAFSLKQLDLQESPENPTPTAIEPNSEICGKLPDDIYSFVRAKAPKNEYQRIAVLTFFLEKRRNIQSVTTKDIVEANTEARQPRFSNISTTVNRASANYKYINSLSRGVYQISATGMELVNALPDQSEIPKMKSMKSSNKRKK